MLETTEPGYTTGNYGYITDIIIIFMFIYSHIKIL